MDFSPLEKIRGFEAPVRIREIAEYLDKPDFDRKLSELTDLTLEERVFLSKEIRRLYQQAKKVSDPELRMRLATRINDCITLLLCDPQERKISVCPPEIVERAIFGKIGDYLTFGTGTSGERVSFQTLDEPGRAPGRYMVYPLPTASASESGKKYFTRFMEAFGSHEVNLDEDEIDNQ